MNLNESIISKNRDNSFFFRRNSKSEIWNKLKSYHPKQILDFESYTVYPKANKYICNISFKANLIDEGERTYCIEFPLNYEPSKEDALTEFSKILNTKRFLGYSNITEINVEDISSAYSKEARKFLYVGKVNFNYSTKRGISKEDSRIFILDIKPNEYELILEFDKWVNSYNSKYPYRALENISVNKTLISSIADIKLLDEINSLELNDRKRILINKTNNRNVLLNQVSVEYYTDKNKRKISDFILPIAAYSLENKISNSEMQNLININKQRKVSNVKILDMTALTFIKL